MVLHVLGSAEPIMQQLTVKKDMFDNIIKPILLYGCEVQGFYNTYLLEKLRLKFCKHTLKLRASTPNFMVYGELGRYLLEINVKVRMIFFWGKLVSFQNSKLSAKLFNVLKNFNNLWCKAIKKI